MQIMANKCLLVVVVVVLLRIFCFMSRSFNVTVFCGLSISRQNIRCNAVLTMLDCRAARTDGNVVMRACSLLDGCRLPERQRIEADEYRLCRNSSLLLTRTQPAVLRRFVPVAVLGDGNCLFRAVSLAMYGVEHYHIVLRTLTAVEVLRHRIWYDASATDCLNPLRTLTDIIMPSYDALCSEVCGKGRSVDMHAIFALSAVIQAPIRSFWPPLSGALQASPLTRTVVGRGVDDSVRPVSVMWTTTGDVTVGNIVINHFVPLVRRRTPGNTEEAPIDQLPMHLDDEEMCIQVDREDVPAGDLQTTVQQTDVVNVGPSRFMEAGELLLTLAEQKTVLKHVPNGLKRNAHFVVDNSDNAQRRKDGLKRHFWDDCGAWSTKDSRLLTTHYIRSGSAVSVTRCVNKVYCKQHMVDKRRRWIPVDPQPSEENVVAVTSYYSTLKSDSNYRKRVSWLEGNPDVAVYEYQGQPPKVNQPHGGARNTDGEYVRTKPCVLQGIREGLSQKRATPRDVYEELVIGNDSDSRPRDHKQVRNVAQQMTDTGCPHKGANVSDEIQLVLQSLHNKSFVKHVAFRHGKLPVIVAYTDEQVRDLSRFCTRNAPENMRSVLGIDRTFNLGPCFVTLSVYRNMAIIRKTSQQHPIFIGPVMFHFDGKADTYSVFFRSLYDALSADVVCTELNGDAEIVFGSDDEKAMVTAMKQVCPCRHLHSFFSTLLRSNCSIK